MCWVDWLSIQTWNTALWSEQQNAKDSAISESFGNGSFLPAMWEMPNAGKSPGSRIELHVIWLLLNSEPNTQMSSRTQTFGWYVLLRQPGITEKQRQLQTLLVPTKESQRLTETHIIQNKPLDQNKYINNLSSICLDKKQSKATSHHPP